MLDVINNSVISVIIRVRDAEHDLKRCLTKLREQILPDDISLEIIVVDNESTDNSVQVAESYNAVIVSIPRNEFTWGRSLNRGIEASSGDIVMLLSADAYPSDSNWILYMTELFNNKSVAAVYGRQIPRPDAPIDEIVRLQKQFISESKTYDRSCFVGRPTGDGMIISNACAAIRKEAWIKYKYDELIEGGEEGVWTCQVINEGGVVKYCHKAVVYHSHNDSIIRNALRMLEILSKNATLTESSFIASVIRYPFQIAKRLINNILLINGYWRAKIMAILRYPFEMVLVGILSLFWKTKYKGIIRSMLW